MTEFKSAIFDMDGTLFASMHMWDSVAANYLKSRGITPKADLNEKIKAKTGRQIARLFRREYKLKLSPDEIIDGFNSLLMDFYANKVALKPGVEKMLETLRGRGIKMCIATATDRHLAEAGLRRTGIIDYFGKIFTCTEAGSGKDRPNIYWQALNFLESEITEAVVFEDAYYALKTAKESGFTTAAVYDASPHHQAESCRSIADYYISTFEDWDAASFGL